MFRFTRRIAYVMWSYEESMYHGESNLLDFENFEMRKHIISSMIYGSKNIVHYVLWV